MKKTKNKTVRPIYASNAIEVAYRKRLDALIAEMANSVQYWTEAAYKANPPKMGLAMDALPSQELSKRIKELSKRWVKRFDDMALKLSERFVSEGLKYTDSSYQQALKDAGWTVQFKMTPPVKDAVNATIKENVSLISNIPEKYMTDIEGIVMRGFTRGRDLHYIGKELQQRHGITKRRAALIALDQSNKLTATVTQARRIELGLFEAEWVHSHAGKEPRQSHVKAGRDKLRFDVRKGALIDGEYILPGEKIRCRCSSRSILPFMDK